MSIGQGGGHYTTTNGQFWSTPVTFTVTNVTFDRAIAQTTAVLERLRLQTASNASTLDRLLGGFHDVVDEPPKVKRIGWNPPPCCPIKPLPPPHEWLLYRFYPDRGPL